MDFLKKYSKHKKINNLSIIAVSFILALSVNFLFLQNSSITKNMKTNILESNKIKNTGDIFLEKKENKIILKTKNKIKDIKNLSLSLIYNPENLEIKEITPKLNSQIEDLSNVDGIKTIIIDFKENYNINQNEKIFSINYSKKTNKTENINIINANFTNSKGETFELTTSGVSF